ncbi:MAG: hypothetical protein U0X40_06060 [Ferruginibacter sp.]
MIRSFLLTMTSLLLLVACNDKKTTALQTDIDVATAFIRDLLDNKLADAEQYLLKDEQNQQYFDALKQQYRQKSKEELAKYKNAEIIINELSNVSDSISIVNYSNSYNKNLKNKVKLVRTNGRWLIDFKYTFSGNL